MNKPRIILKGQPDKVHGNAISVEDFIQGRLLEHQSMLEENSRQLAVLPTQIQALNDLKVTQNTEFQEVKESLEKRLSLNLDATAQEKTEQELERAQSALSANLENIDKKIAELSNEKQRLETTTISAPTLDPNSYEVHPADMGLMVKLLTDAGRKQAQAKVQEAHGFGSNPRTAIVFALSMIGKVANIVELIFVVLLGMIKAQKAAFEQVGATDGLAVMNAYGMITLAEKIELSGVTSQFVSDTNDADAIISEYVAAAITTKTALASAPRNVAPQERSLLQPAATILVFEEVPHNQILIKNGITTLDEIPSTRKELEALDGFNAKKAKAVLNFVKADGKQ